MGAICITALREGSRCAIHAQIWHWLQVGCLGWHGKHKAAFIAVMQAAKHEHERDHGTHCVVALLVEGEVHLQAGSVTNTRQGKCDQHTISATTCFHALHGLHQAALSRPAQQQG